MYVITVRNVSPRSLLCRMIHDVLNHIILAPSSNSQVVKLGVVQYLPIREYSLAHKDHMPVGKGDGVYQKNCCMLEAKLKTSHKSSLSDFTVIISFLLS